MLQMVKSKKNGFFTGLSFVFIRFFLIQWKNNRYC